MGLSRDVVYKIKSGSLVCRTETKCERPVVSKTEQNIKKRKISLECILKIVDYTLENKKPSDIMELLESSNPITIDIVKNIKRTIMQKQVPFYPIETTEDIYKYYQDKITMFVNVWSYGQKPIWPAYMSSCRFCCPWATNPTTSH